MTYLVNIDYWLNFLSCFFQQLEDGLCMYDYNVNINDVLQLMERMIPVQSVEKKKNKNKQDTNKSPIFKDEILLEVCYFYL